MTTRTKPSKRKWRADPSVIYRVMSRTQPYTEAEQAHIAIPHWSSLTRITKGTAETGDLDQVGLVINVAMVLSEQTHQECADVSLRAAKAVVQAKSRWRKLGRVGFDGKGLQDVRDGLHLYDEYLKHITPKQHIDALHEVNRRIGAGIFLEEAA